MIGNSEVGEQAAAIPADRIVDERQRGLFQIALCAADPAHSLMPSEPIIGGYRFQNAPQIELTTGDPQSPEKGADHG